MSPGTATRKPLPSADALASRTAVGLGAAVLAQRQRRGWTTRTLAERARIAPGTVSGVEAGRRASLDVYARLASALGFTLDISLAGRKRRQSHEGQDQVHAALGEHWAKLLQALTYHVFIDHPYQHYQFAGRTDVLSWSLEPPALLRIENRTRFPDLQQAAGSFNAKRQYLARTVATRLGIRGFESETHVMAGLWSAEVSHSVRLRPATFKSLCPDDAGPFHAWLAGHPPAAGVTSAFILLDPFASGRQAPTAGLHAAIERARPRFRGYAEAARRLSER